MLYDFQNFGLIKMSNPLPLEELFVLGLSSQETEWDPDLGKKILKNSFISHIKLEFSL